MLYGKIGASFALLAIMSCESPSEPLGTGIFESSQPAHKLSGSVTIRHDYAIPRSQAQYRRWLQALREKKRQSSVPGQSNFECGPAQEVRSGAGSAKVVQYLPEIVFWYPPDPYSFGGSLGFGLSKDAAGFSCGSGGGFTEYGSSSVGPFAVRQGTEIEEEDNPPEYPPPGMEQSDYNELNPAEKQLAWIVFYNFGGAGLAALAFIRSDAESWAQGMTSIGAHNGPQDALRHAYWQCRMTKSFGESLAEAWGNAHEKYATDFGEVRMDLFNNAEGRRLGLLGAGCADSVLDAWTKLHLAEAPIPGPSSIVPPGDAPPPPPGWAQQ